MIDVVFLMLFYFMVTTSLKKVEADLGISLPGTVEQTGSVKLPDEQIIEIDPSGTVILNGQTFDSADTREMPSLVATLVRFRQASEASGNPPMITVQPSPDTQHQRVIDVLNACAAARISNVSFGS